MADQKNKKVNENVKLEKEIDSLNIKKELPKRKSFRLLILSSFIQRLKEDKLYLLCFIITILTFSVYSSIKVQESEGAFTKKSETVVEKGDTNEVSNDEKLDVTSLVGIYIKSYKLDKKFKYGDSCEVSGYDFVYEIKKDNSINHYIVNDCFGTVLLSSDMLGYINGGNVRNIGSKKAIYVFNNNKLSEIDGLTYVKNDKYKLGTEITKLVNSKLTFYGDKFIVLNDNDLYLINGNKIDFELIPKTLLTKSIYKIDKNTYKYFVYNDEETEVCYEDINLAEVGFEDKEIYSIYSIMFDEAALSFKDSVLETTRNRSDTCEILDTDINKYND